MNESKRKPMDTRLLLKFRGKVRENVVRPIMEAWTQRQRDRDAARKKFIA